MKRPTSTVMQFRQRIPADVLQTARGCPLAIPLGDGVVSMTVSARAETVVFSLRTRDPREAKARQGIAAAYLERVWQGLRDGPVGLTHRNREALAGEIYRAFVASLEDEPGTAGAWALVRNDIRSIRDDRVGDVLIQREAFSRIGLMFGEESRRKAALEQLFGGFVDQQLARRALRVDDDTRTGLLNAFGKAVDDAAARLQRNAEGDYRPDENVKRFPEWRDPAPSTPAPPAFTFKALVDGWWAEAQAGGLTRSTLQSYSATAAKLSAFLGHEDAGRVTMEDVIRFKDHRLASTSSTGKPISAVTVKDNDLAGLKSLYGWALRNCKVTLNPALNVTLKVGKKVQTRSKGLTDAETAATLRAANVPAGPRVRPKMAAACRWVPWLLAYTGARLGEMVQLRRQDVQLIGGIWALNITPDAGTVKDKEARVVPLHPHLVEMGFPDSAQRSDLGHLFFDVNELGDWVGPWRTAKNRVRERAREAIGGAEVSPNHGWRHRFKTVGRGVGIGEALLDSITGHAPATVGASYGDYPLAVQAEAIARLPRYQVE